MAEVYLACGNGECGWVGSCGHTVHAGHAAVEEGVCYMVWSRARVGLGSHRIVVYAVSHDLALTSLANLLPSGWHSIRMAK